MSSDSNWQIVSQFVSDLRNASRLATYVDTVVDVFESGAWRNYTDATGRADNWRSCEFDFFLIACGAEYAEVQRLLTWDRARAVDLAAAMESEDVRQRRQIERASEAWQSPTGASLLELAERQGWTKNTGGLRAPPVPARARARARHGVSKDTRARQRRAAQLAEARRKKLDGIVKSVATEAADELELRYIADGLRDKIAEKASGSPDT